MRTPEKQLVIKNPEVETVYGTLGISKERMTQIETEVDTIIKKELENDGDAATTIVAVYNAFENRAEVAMALFILNREEDKVILSSMITPDAIEA